MNALNQLDLGNTYNTPPNKSRITLSSQVQYGTFSREDLTLGYKINFRKFKKIDIIQSMLSDHKRMKLETNNRNSQICGN